MKELSKNSQRNESNLANLASLIGIDSNIYGWKTELSQWFKVDISVLSNWIRRGIPKKRIENAVKKGFPIEKWLVKNDEILSEASKSGPGTTISGEDDPKHGKSNKRPPGDDSQLVGLTLEKQIELYKENERLKIMIEERDRALMFVLNAHKPPEGEKERRESFIILRYFVNNLKGQR